MKVLLKGMAALPNQDREIIFKLVTCIGFQTSLRFVGKFKDKSKGINHVKILIFKKTVQKNSLD